ncbi:MAG: hypothetical protein WD749_14925 [Phycisphaerales bacterium]
MSLIGASAAQSLAGLSQAERAEAGAKRPAAAKAADPPRKADADHVVVKTETADAVRRLNANDQEEAREDRKEHPAYTPQGGLAPGGPPGKLDLNG